MYFEKPEFEVVKFESEDVIVASRGQGGDTCYGATDADCGWSYMFGNK